MKTHTIRRTLNLALIAILLTSSMLILGPTQIAQAATFTVNSTADGNDANPGDAICNDGGGNCTLRAAISETNALTGADTIGFDPSLNGANITLSITGANENLNATGDLDITDDLTITGNGIANTIISGASLDRVFNIRGGATVDIEFLTIQDGNINNRGGGIWVESSTLTLNDSLIRNNTSTSGPSGGGLFNTTGTVTINRSEFTGNTGNGGGAISQQTNATMTINDTIISGNNSTARGGGITNYVGGTMTIVNSTINNNTSTSSGGGIANNNVLTIYNSTIVNNTTTNGNGGGIDAISNETIVNTIIGNNVDAGGQSPDCNSTITANYSLIESNLLCTISGSNNIIGLDPNLGALADNGGPTWTHFPQINSPVIDKGDCGAGTDQRGLPRPVDVDDTYYPNTAASACDIGAVEVQAVGPNALSLQSFSANAGTQFLSGTAFLGMLLLVLGSLFIWKRRKGSQVI